MKTPDGQIFQCKAGYDAEMARQKRLGLDRVTAKQGGDEDPGGVYAFRQSIFSRYQVKVDKPQEKAQSVPVRAGDPSGAFSFRESLFAGGRR